MPKANSIRGTAIWPSRAALVTRYSGSGICRLATSSPAKAAQSTGLLSQPQRELLAERINMPTEKWSRLESTKRMTMAPSCCSPKASTISGMPRLPVLRNMAGRISAARSISLSLSRASSRPGSRITRAPAAMSGRWAARSSGYFTSAEKTSAGVKSSILARLT